MTSRGRVHRRVEEKTYAESCFVSVMFAQLCALAHRRAVLSSKAGFHSSSIRMGARYVQIGLCVCCQAHPGQVGQRWGCC